MYNETSMTDTTDDERALLVVSPEKAVPRLNKVPQWLYTETVTVLCVKITYAAFIWWANLVACLGHVGFASIAVWAATRDGKTMATPLLKVYLTDLTWIPNATDALMPEYQEAGGLYLSWMTLSFFILSALAHGTVCFFNFRQAFAIDSKGNVDPIWSRINYWSGWYFVYLVSHARVSWAPHYSHDPFMCAARVPKPLALGGM